MLRGSNSAKVDDKGRLKVPANFRSVIEPQYGNEFFVTSLFGDSVRIYPLQVYAELEQRLIQSSSVGPAVSKFRTALNYYGQGAVMDQQGRILIHPLLRSRADINGEVVVLGQQNFLEVWNRAAFEKKMELDPLTEEDLTQLEALGF